MSKVEEEKQKITDHAKGVYNGINNVKDGLLDGLVTPSNHKNNDDYWEGYKEGQNIRERR